MFKLHCDGMEKMTDANRQEKSHMPLSREL